MHRALALTTVFLGGCLTFSDFEITRPIAERTLPGSPAVAPLPADFPLSLSLDFTDQLGSLHVNQVSITLVSLALDVTPTKDPMGDTDDFGFIDGLHVFATGSTLPKVEIAHARMHGAAATLDFGVADDLDLAPYIGDTSTVGAVGSGVVPPDDISFDGTVVFRVSQNHN